MQKYAHSNRDLKGAIHIPFIYQSRKNGSVIYSFLGKRGLIVYLAALKNGAIRAAHPYHVIYRELPPPPPSVYLAKSEEILGSYPNDIQFIICQYFSIKLKLVTFLTGIHILCFRAKIRRKNVYPCKLQFYYIKVRFRRLLITRAYLHDGIITIED